ncbi:hypothetical protein BJ875DRAFT_485252 [Amylocarpus encephaloides]|uniref:Uncharacterized protein n=1 Tax=Amylocarpus encephaloides TaxID=45428 RepID=A0A9P7YHS5_9HELO|nr:hypothetical protein BJ875DRAFT_485252 [Amylocarpus encephaloides]
MWQRSEPGMNLPTVEVTASTPLRANFDSDYRKGPTSLYESSDVDDGKDTSIENGKPQWNTIFHLNREPLPEHSDIYFGKTDWRSIANILLAIYATFFSGISLAIAIRQPRYGNLISPTGPLIPSTADLLFSLFSKSIEIASAGVYITFIGQFLTRRSLRSRGIGLTDIALREWLLQPGFVIWHWDNLKFASTTILGFTTLLTAIGIFFFTSASNTLVSPHVATGQWETSRFYGNVEQDFGNVILLKKNCWSPIDAQLDTLNPGESCVNILASGWAHQDMNNYMKDWSRKATEGSNFSSNISFRPKATSSIFEDTKTAGSWVERASSNLTSQSLKYGRVVNNITLSMPHPVVYYSARTEFPDPVKGSGFGEHTVKASVVSPTSNTLCVNMNRSEVEPLVYVEFPNARFTTNSAGRKIAATDWFNDVAGDASLRPNLTRTGVEDIFKWGPAYSRKFPLFKQWPIDYNSIFNITVLKSDSIYLLIKSPNTTDYTICQMSGRLSPDCLTKHTQKVGAQKLNSECGSDEMSFKQSIAPAIFHSKPSTDFRDYLGAWATAVGLNGGEFNSNNSNSHVLSQLIVTNSSGKVPSLNVSMPSIAEALAVSSNSMLIKASIDATFDNRTVPKAPTAPTLFPYDVIVQNQQYKSGPPDPWQAILYPILVIIFVANFYCLTYFLRELGLVVDFLDPQNLFSVAIESPDESERSAAGKGFVVHHNDAAWNLRRDSNRKLIFKRRRVEEVALNEKSDLDDNWI